MQPGRARTSGLGVPLLPPARWVGWVAPVRPTHGVLVLSCPSAALRVCSFLGRLAPVHRCARAVCCVASAVSWATWLLFTGVLALCVVLRVRCRGRLGSRSPVRPLGVSCCVCGVLDHLAPVHRCARSVCCFACAVSWATWLLFTGVPARCVFFFFFLGGAARPRRFLSCAWVWMCASAGAGVGLGVVGDGGWVAAALVVPCMCAGPQASGFQGVGPGGVDGGWLAAVVAWRLRGWSRLLRSAWLAWPGAGARVGVFMASADGLVGSMGVAGLCGCRVCVRRRRGGLGWGTVGDAVGGRDVGEAYGGGCCRRRNGLVLLARVLQVMRRAATGLVTLMVS